ncbi:MAG TPA: hypothetical protein VIG46_04885 [Candidatus Baltobacteraceae bacterium]|jgi:hypothetical protein
MRAISLHERALLLRISAVTCAVAGLLLPIAAQSSSVVIPTERVGAPVAVPTVAPALVRAGVWARVRDPFVALVGSETSAKAAAPVLVAFAEGVRPVALVEIDGQTVALMRGSTALGARVTYVDARIVRLSDGRTLALRRSQ